MAFQGTSTMEPTYLEQMNVSSGDRRYRDDTEDFDNAMDEHAPALHSSLQNTENLVRGIVQNAMSPSSHHRKKSSSHGVRRASTSTSSSHTPRHHRDPHRTASLSHGHGLTNGHNTSGGSTPTTTIPSMEEISLLINRLSSERQKTASLQGSLTQAHADLAFQTKRLETADEQLKVLKKKEEAGSAKRKQMEIDRSRMKEQLQFLKTQYDAAVAEIKKAQQEIDQLDEERHSAAEEIAREKKKVRELLEERKLRAAREEGYKEGVKMGRDEGVKMGADTARKYGVKDGKEAEKRRQNLAMRELVQDVEAGVDLPQTPPNEHVQRHPPIRETYHMVDAETPGQERRGMNVDPSIGFGRSRPVTDMPAPTVRPDTFALAGTGSSAYAASAPLPTTTNQPSYQQQQIRNGEPPYQPPPRNNQFDSGNANINIIAGGPGLPNPNINILTGGQGLAEPGPGMSSRQGNRTSAPPNININPAGQRSWGGGVVGTGGGAGSNQGYRAPIRPRSDSGGTRGGRSTVTPPSASTQDRSTPLDNYDILRNPNNPHQGGGGRMSAGGGLREQVLEMTPIMEGGSEPGPSPVGPYFQDAAMGVRAPVQPPNQQRQGYQPNDRPTGNAYQPPHKRAGPSPTTPTAPGGQGRGTSTADQATQWRQPSGHAKHGRKPVPGDGSSSDGFGKSSGSGRSHTRSQSHAHPHTHANVPANANARAGGRSRGASFSGGEVIPPPIEVRPSTPPSIGNARSAKMAHAGNSLMGSPSFQPTTMGYAGAPPPVGGQGQQQRTGPNGTPRASPQMRRSPLPDQRELTRNDFVSNDPSGRPYRSTSEQPPYGQGQGQRGVNGHGRGGSMSAMDKDLPPPAPSPRFNANQNLAQPTPRRYSNALEMSPEVIQIHSSGTTPMATPFDLNGQYIGGDIPPPPKAKGKGKVSAEQKKRRREGFVDYDDEVPQIGTLGYGPQDQEPPMTTRSRVQSMYGIRPGEDPHRSPMFDAPPLPAPGNGPKRTPAYEAAPLPPPKSARMMTGGLPANAGYGRGTDPVPSPQKSTSSSQIRRAMEDDLDTPLHPYDHLTRNHVGNHPDHHEEDHGDPRVLNIGILEEKAEGWDQRSGKFLQRKLPQTYEDVMEVVPPPNAAPSHRPVQQDASFLGTGNHPPPPPSPNTVQRGPPNAYVSSSNFDDTNVVLPPNPVLSGIQGDPGRSPMMRQSMPVTASARSSNHTLPPVQPSDLPWATGRTNTSQLPRQSMYEPAPSTAGMPPNTSTTWGYVRDSMQTVAPVGPIGNDGLGFTFRSSNMPQETYALAPPSPQMMPPPGSARANIMQMPGSARSNIMNIPGTNRSISQPLPSTQSQMLERMLTPDAAAPEPDNEPIIPKKAKKGKKKGK